jgi:hypothetical protein
MPSSEQHYVRRILQGQRNAVELVLVAVVLAFGVNIASNAFPAKLGLAADAGLALGLGLCLLSLLYAVYRVSASLSMSVKLQGLLLLGKENQVHEIERYRFSQSTASSVCGLTVENKALGASWKKANLGGCFEGRGDPKHRNSDAGQQLVLEAIEYFVLDELSLHLSEYFESERSVSDDAVARIKRRDIPQVLLDNHFLDLFSKPMSEREAFTHHNDDEARNVVAAWGPNGEVFDQFELILPKGSSLSRADDALLIKTSRYVLRIQSIYEGFSTNLPSDFEESYLGKKFNTYSPHQVDLELSVKFAWRSLLTPRGWDHYEWLDSFIAKLERTFSFESFIHQIGWETAHSVAIAMRNASKVKSNAG